MSETRVQTKFAIWGVRHVIEADGRIRAVEIEGRPVTSDRDAHRERPGATENDRFWNATPSGALKLTITNPAMFDAFRPGQSWYVTFDLAEGPPI